MYIEISPRETGKTERLLKTASDSTEHAIVVCCNAGQRKYTQDRIMAEEAPDHRLDVYAGMIDKFTVITWQQYLKEKYPDEKSCKFFFDEFNFYGNFQKDKGYSLTEKQISKLIREDGYYCSTPSRIRLSNKMGFDLLHLLLFEALQKKTPISSFPQLVGANKVTPDDYSDYEHFCMERLGQYIM